MRLLRKLQHQTWTDHGCRNPSLLQREPTRTSRTVVPRLPTTGTVAQSLPNQANSSTKLADTYSSPHAEPRTWAPRGSTADGDTCNSQWSLPTRAAPNQSSRGLDFLHKQQMPRVALRLQARQGSQNEPNGYENWLPFRHKPAPSGGNSLQVSPKDALPHLPHTTVVAPASQNTSDNDAPNEQTIVRIPSWRFRRLPARSTVVSIRVYVLPSNAIADRTCCSNGWIYIDRKHVNRD